MPHTLKKLETAILEVMITAHASYYGRALTEVEFTDFNKTISQLQKEIDSRKKKKLSTLLIKQKQ